MKISSRNQSNVWSFVSLWRVIVMCM